MESGSAIVPASLAGINAESDSTAFVNLPRFYALGNRSSNVILVYIKFICVFYI